MSTVHLSFRVEAKYNPCPTVDWSGTHKCNSWKINQAILCKCIKALCCITHTPYLRTDTVQSLIFTIREWNNIKTYSWEKHRWWLCAVTLQQCRRENNHHSPRGMRRIKTAHSVWQLLFPTNLLLYYKMNR